MPKQGVLEPCPEKKRQTRGWGGGEIDNQRRKEAERQMDREGQRGVGERKQEGGSQRW